MRKGNNGTMKWKDFSEKVINGCWGKDQVYYKYKTDYWHEGGGFPTPSTKFEFYSNHLESLGYDALPVFNEPGESPVSTPELFEEYPLVMSSGGNSGSQATSLVTRAMALKEVQLRDWWRVMMRELPTGITLGAALGAIGFVRVIVWQKLHLYDYGQHGVPYMLVALNTFCSLVGIVMFGSLAGSMLPFVLRRLGFDPASASAPFVATLVDVTGLIIYFSVALVILGKYMG